MKNTNDSKIVFDRSAKGKHNEFSNNTEELLNNDNSLNKPGTQIGDTSFESSGDSYKDMPLYGRKDK